MRLSTGCMYMFDHSIACLSFIWRKRSSGNSRKRTSIMEVVEYLLFLSIVCDCRRLEVDVKVLWFKKKIIYEWDIQVYAILCNVNEDILQKVKQLNKEMPIDFEKRMQNKEVLGRLILIQGAWNSTRTKYRISSTGCWVSLQYITQTEPVTINRRQSRSFSTCSVKFPYYIHSRRPPTIPATPCSHTFSQSNRLF